ncbi:hypothetical protein [Burkholderia ubonensis]|uniref:hypothetical protein n=1 Tax=Burkholderia ubonensis TaxID=101571 RepID=UPI0021091045|nr:hypothetical protein [Burkholderia ubonensis]
MKDDDRAARDSRRLGHQSAKFLRRRPCAQSVGYDVIDGGFFREIDQAILHQHDSREDDQTRDGDTQHGSGEFHRIEPNLPSPAGEFAIRSTLFRYPVRNFVMDAVAPPIKHTPAGRLARGVGGWRRLSPTRTS